MIPPFFRPETSLNISFSVKEETNADMERCYIERIIQGGLMGELDLILIIKMVIIGIVQVFTEPIPVSSSGHVMIASEILGLGEQGFTFAILTNTASLLAIMFIYRSDIARLAVNSIQYIRTREQTYKSDF